MWPKISAYSDLSPTGVCSLRIHRIILCLRAYVTDIGRAAGQVTGTLSPLHRNASTGFILAKELRVWLQAGHGGEAKVHQLDNAFLF